MDCLALLLLLCLQEPAASGPASRPEAAAIEFQSRLAGEALAFAEAEAAKLPGTYRIRLVQPPNPPAVPRGEVRVDSLRLSKGEPTGRFFVSLKLSAEGRPAGYARVDLEGTWTGSLLRTRENLPRKAVLDPSMLESTPFEGTPPPGSLTAVPEGMRLRQPVNAGKVLTRADLESIPLVQSGERVRLSAMLPGLSIQVEGTARNTGGQGERVRVEIAGTRKLVQAIVSGEHETCLAGFDQKSK
jgi:flagella basal body P-ring formation protein FlgA